MSQKQLYVHPVDLQGGGVHGVGMGTGWVGEGLYRYPASCPGRGPETAERAPEGPSGTWSGWSQELGRTAYGQMKAILRSIMGPGDGGGDGPRTTLRARSVPAGPPCPGTLQIAASWPYRRDLTSFH